MSKTDSPKVFNKRPAKTRGNPNLKTDADFKNYYLILVGSDIETSNNITEFLEEFGYLALLKDDVHPKCISEIEKKIGCAKAEHIFVFDQKEMDTELLLEEWSEFYDGGECEVSSHKLIATYKHGKNIVELQSQLKLK